LGSDWEGNSGAAIVCDGLVIGVQRQHQNPKRPASLEASPLWAVYSNEQWCGLLRKHGINPKPAIAVEVIRNDQISVQEVKQRIEQGIYDAIVISPGSGCPADAGITLDLIRELGASCEAEGDVWMGIPILGVCLGHQAIGEVFGGQVIRAPEPVHGKPAQVYHQGKGVFAGLPSPFKAPRYHSLMVDWDTLPEDLEVIAWTEDNLIMGLQHRKYP